MTLFLLSLQFHIFWHRSSRQALRWRCVSGFIIATCIGAEYTQCPTTCRTSRLLQAFTLCGTGWCSVSVETVFDETLSTETSRAWSKGAFTILFYHYFHVLGWLYGMIQFILLLGFQLSLVKNKKADRKLFWYSCCYMESIWQKD